MGPSLACRASRRTSTLGPLAVELLGLVAKALGLQARFGHCYKAFTSGGKVIECFRAGARYACKLKPVCEGRGVESRARAHGDLANTVVIAVAFRLIAIAMRWRE